MRHTWGTIGPSYLFSENGDLSILLHFSIQWLVGNIQGKRNHLKISLLWIIQNAVRSNS